METSQTLDRGLQVLQALVGESAGLSVTEIADRIAVNRTVAHRLVATLAQRGMVRRDASGRIHIGMALLGLSSAVRPVLRDTAVPILRQLAETLGCTAHLSVADGEEAVAFAVVEPSWTDFHVAFRAGSRHPLAHGAAGKAILLVRSDSAREHVATTGELQSGAHGLAAPLRGVTGLEASVGIVTLGGPLDEALIAPRVVAAAIELAEALS